LIELLTESGCRIREALNLTKDDIEVQNDFVIITVTGKTGTRIVPLLKDNLTSFLYHVAIVDTDKIFPITYWTINYQFQNIYKKANVKVSKIFHIFRHTKATYLLEQGVSESIIKQFLGWTSNSPMIARYTHLTSRNIQEYFGRLYGLNVDPVEPLYPDEEKERLKQIFR
jgi:integrase/recombinase XerD